MIFFEYNTEILSNGHAQKKKRILQASLAFVVQ